MTIEPGDWVLLAEPLSGYHIIEAVISCHRGKFKTTRHERLTVRDILEVRKPPRAEAKETT